MLPELLVPLEEGLDVVEPDDGLLELPEPEGEVLLPAVLSVEGALDGEALLPEVPVEDELDGDVPLLDGDVPLSEVLPPEVAPLEGEL